MATLTPARRRELLDTITSPDAPPDALDAARTEYFDGLPSVPISRCPFTDVVVTRTIDTFGIDGPWWDHDDSQRGFPLYPDSVWSLSGSMRLAEPVESADFLVKPGPAVPYVLEHLIRHRSITAVISTVPVGRHLGYVVVYFLDGDEGPALLARSNDWGAPDHWYRDDNGWWHDSVAEYEEERDFDLARWVANGKLKWIQPGDADLRLRGDVPHCPYLGLEGTQESQRVQDGEVWTAPLPPVAPPADPTESPARRRRRGGQDSGSTNTNPPE